MSKHNKFDGAPVVEDGDILNAFAASVPDSEGSTHPQVQFDANKYLDVAKKLAAVAGPLVVAVTANNFTTPVGAAKGIVAVVNVLADAGLFNFSPKS